MKKQTKRWNILMFCDHCKKQLSEEMLRASFEPMLELELKRKNQKFLKLLDELREFIEHNDDCYIDKIDEIEEKIKNA